MSPTSPSKAIAERLRSLLGTQLSPDQHAFVLEQLASRRSGFESLAARVLAGWGRPEDRESIKGWFEERWPAHASGFRPDLIEVFRPFTDPTDVAWLVDLFVRGTTGLRASLGFVLRERPEAREIAGELVARGDVDLTIDTIEGFMWSRSRYRTLLQRLAASAHPRGRALAEGRRDLFRRFPALYE
jgi:hypothetical protein